MYTCYFTSTYKKVTNKTVTAISNKRQIVKYTKSEHTTNSPIDKICGNKVLPKRGNNTPKSYTNIKKKENTQFDKQTGVFP